MKGLKCLTAAVIDSASASHSNQNLNHVTWCLHNFVTVEALKEQAVLASDIQRGSKISLGHQSLRHNPKFFYSFNFHCDYITKKKIINDITK